MHARARACARAAGKACFLAPSYSRVQHDGRLVAPREHGPDAGEDATPVVCRRQHDKALPGCHREELWAVSGPQRGINCKEASKPPKARRRPPKARRRPAEAARARSSGSPTVRSGPVDAQPPLQCTANHGGRQRISLDTRSRLCGKRRWTLFEHHTTCLHNERRREWPQKSARSGRTAR